MCAPWLRDAPFKSSGESAVSSQWTMEQGDRKSHSSPPPVETAEELEFDDPTLVRSVAPGPMAPADLERVERLRVLKAIEACDGNQARAAQLLGVSRKTLNDLLEKSNLPRPRKR